MRFSSSKEPAGIYSLLLGIARLRSGVRIATAHELSSLASVWKLLEKIDVDLHYRHQTQKCTCLVA